ncbi:hypothetical protein ACHAWT_006336 [Skeletonema menzelii]
MNGWLPEYDESESESTLIIDTANTFGLVEETSDRGVNIDRSKAVGQVDYEGESSDEKQESKEELQNNFEVETTTTTATTTTTTTTKTTTTTSKAPKLVQQNTAIEKNRLYCMVPFIWTPKFLPSYHAIHATWGKRCHILRFFIDPIIGDSQVGYYNITLASDALAAANDANFTLPKDVVVLHDMQRPWHSCEGINDEDKTCRNIWEKIWRAWVYVVTGKGGSTPAGSDVIIGANSSEWFVKVDADTFLFPENLSRYVKSRGWSYDDHHYFGHVLHHRVKDRGVPIVAGAAVFFSRATLVAAADSFQKMSTENGNEEEDGTCRDANTGTEEVVTAVCLKEHSNIIAEPAIDSLGRDEISLFPVDDMIVYNRTDHGEWWFWEGKKRIPCHDAGDCLGDLPLALHGYKDSEFLLYLENEFYGSVMKGQKDDSLAKRNDNKIAAYNWENFDRTYKYFERVRAAMKIAAKEEALGSDISIAKELPAQGKDRLYCMVPFILAPQNMPTYEAIRNTWGKRCDTLKFFVDPIVEDDQGNFIDLRRKSGTKMTLPHDVVVVYHIYRPWHICESKKDTTCRNIWEKVWRSWLWIDDNGESDSSEWFAKIDADSYLFPENAKKYVQDNNMSPDEHHYFGHTLRHSEDRNLPPIVAGSAVFFSRATVKGAAAIFREFKHEEHNKSVRKCSDSYTASEETLTALCLKQHLGIYAAHALDDSGDELIAISPIEDTLLWNRTEQGEWWYWKNKPETDPRTGREIHKCCGDFPIAFHGYKDPLWFYKLEDELYGMDDLPGVTDKWRRYKWHNPNEANSYFDRMRKARNTEV